MLVFYGDLIHAGAEYSQANTRIHIYLDSPEVVRDFNTTYLKNN